MERPKAEPIPEPLPRVPPPIERSVRPLSGVFDPGLRRLNIPYMPRPDAPPLRPERSKTLELLDEIFRKSEGQPQTREPSQNPLNELIVPMVCSETRRAFAARFTRSRTTDQWRFAEAFLVGLGKGTAGPKAMTVPLNEMNWAGAVCPGCGKGCGPIFCGECQQLGCDGGVIAAASLRRMYRCSCGSTGFLEATLKAVSGAKGSKAQEPQSGTASTSYPSLLRLPRRE
jgi:hypothetical protein